MSKIRALSRRKKVFLSIITLSLLIILAIGTVNAVVIPPGQVNAEKVAEANGDGTYDVKIDVTGTPFTTGEDAGRYDVVLVIDKSTSMNTDMGSSGSRLDAAKSAAISFVNTILGEDANENNRVALVSFGTDGQQVLDFTDNINSLTNAINGLSAGSGWDAQYTNIQEGLIFARDYIDNDADDAANKIVILLSDGEPTRSVNNLYWNNSSYGDTGRYLDENQMADDWYPSNYNNDGSGFSSEDRFFDRIIVEANKIRSLGADIYTVGINTADNDNMDIALGNDPDYHFSRNSGVAAWKSGSHYYYIEHPYNLEATRDSGTSHQYGYLIPGFDDFEVAYATEYYTTSDADELEDIFEGLMQEFSTVATNGVVTDVLPEYFDPVLSSLPANASYDSNTKTITWNVGSIGDKKTLEYTVTPVEYYDGEGYTNDDTVTLTATAVDDNPYYSSNPAININVLLPERHDQAVINDQYEGLNDSVNGVDRKTPINITEATLLSNDSVKTLHYVTRNSSDTADEIAYNVAAHACLLSGGSYDPLYGTVVQNADGSFTYTYDLSIPYSHSKTVDYFYYYLSDPATGNPNGTDSDPIKVTVNLKELADVDVYYLDKVTNNDIVGHETLVKQIDETVDYGDVEKDLLTDHGFVYDSGNPELNPAKPSYVSDYTVISGTNTLVLYYVSANCTVDVYFRDKDTDELIGDEMQTLDRNIW